MQTCQCGCGRPSRGRYAKGHNITSPMPTSIERKAHQRFWDEAGVPYGLCLCGCGLQTNIAPESARRNHILRGEPMRYVRGHASRRKVLYTVEDRGYETQCWVVTGHRTYDGYGRMVAEVGGKQRMAHVVMWERANGPVPTGLQLDHLCRNPPCIRPDHLEPVTGAENVRRGSNTRLTLEQVREIRRQLVAGAKQKDLAPLYGVSAPTISAIATGRNWPEIRP